jgi:hypothetical protein
MLQNEKTGQAVLRSSIRFGTKWTDAMFHLPLATKNLQMHYRHYARPKPMDAGGAYLNRHPTHEGHHLRWARPPSEPGTSRNGTRIPPLGWFGATCRRAA